MSQRPIALAITVFILLGMLSVGVAVAEEAEVATPAPPALSSEEAIREDAVAYAKDYGVSVTEAERRLHLQAAMHDVSAAARAAHPDAYAGSWVEHVPSFTLVLSFAGDRVDESPIQALATAAGVPARVVVDAPYTERELLENMAQLKRMLAAWPQATLHPDLRTGELVVGGVAPSEADVEPLREQVDVPIRVEPSAPYVPSHTYGGARMFNSEYVCTSGFTIRNVDTGAQGVLTAGHCPEPFSYDQPNSNDVYPTTMMGQRADDHKDAQWHTSGHLVYPQFWDFDSLRNQGNNVARLDMTGDYVCHYGIATGYSCGTVQTIHFWPGDICGYDFNDPCASTWVQVTGSALRCSWGDSAGPFFAGTAMYGTAAHAKISGSTCYGMTFMSLGFLSEMTLETLKAS